MARGKASPTLGERVRQARLARGLSPNGLARRSGVSRGALRLLEQGEDVRRSTVVRVLRALPEVEPHDAIPGTEGRVPNAATGPWNVLRRLHGVVADRQRLSVRRTDRGLEVTEELVGVKGDAPTDDLLRLAWRGAASPLPLVVDGEPLVVEANGTRHEARVRRRKAGVAVDVRRISLHPETATSPPAAVVELPVKTLELVSASRTTSLRVWPVPLIPEPGEQDAASRLHPESKGTRRRARAGGEAWEIDRPLMGFAYALGPAPASGPVRRTSTRPATPLSRARAAAGSSMRELAEASGIPFTTIADAAAGRDARLSVLGRIAAALPALSAWDLLECDADGDVDACRRAWTWQRDAHGCEIDEESKRVTIDAAGNASLVIRTRGLRRRDAAAHGELRVRIGHVLPVVQASRAKLEHVGTQPLRGLPELRIGKAHASDGSPAHVLVIPERVADRGASYSRRLAHRGVYAMTPERARARTGADGPFFEGTTFAPFLPTRRLVLGVTFPKDFEPRDLSAGAWPMKALPEPEATDVRDRLQREGQVLSLQRRGARVTLVVDRPLLGFKYGLSWRLD